MRELISRITVSVPGRLTDPLKCTLSGGIAILQYERVLGPRVVTAAAAARRRSADTPGRDQPAWRRAYPGGPCAPQAQVSDAPGQSGHVFWATSLPDRCPSARATPLTSVGLICASTVQLSSFWRSEREPRTVAGGHR